VPEPIVRVFPHAEALSRAAADQFVSLAAEAIAARGRFVVALSGGETPLAMYHLLVPAPVEWSGVHVFWGDERCVPPDDRESNYYQARLAWLDRVPLPPGNIHRVHGELDSQQAAADYCHQLREAARPGDPAGWPRFDLVLLGLGADGHTASLFPGSIPPGEADSPVLAVTAYYQNRPAGRVTLTPRVFNAARCIWFLVAGANKAEALAASLQGARDPLRWPAQRLQPTDGVITWLADQAAADQLKGLP
jgi:6-phosphogluconolactonase